jgi:hypothetical protein
MHQNNTIPHYCGSCLYAGDFGGCYFYLFVKSLSAIYIIYSKNDRGLPSPPPKNGSKINQFRVLKKQKRTILESYEMTQGNRVRLKNRA